MNIEVSPGFDPKESNEDVSDLRRVCREGGLSDEEIQQVEEAAKQDFSEAAGLAIEMLNLKVAEAVEKFTNKIHELQAPKEKQKPSQSLASKLWGFFRGE